ncbi:uncharacterized protein LOC126880354 isoform X1 [Diabrotica virgifera virgifera]|uniref:Uncharacterized protein n=1 Tax=Diabrotica virgifera virgifera TaxID=50390 RepID=A0ABM5JQA7_DIAVI|nr:uncharacterized protein LOC126880354 isoform X1 [Diabrotica virgifera virgifera]
MATIFSSHQLLKSIRFLQTYRRIQLRRKSFFGDKNIELGETTLTGRLLRYLNSFNVHGNENFIPVKDPIKLKTTGLNKCNIEQIKTSVRLLDISQDINNFYLLRAIDKECSARVNKLSNADIFELLHIYMSKVPNRIINYKLYEIAIQELTKRLNLLNKNEIIQLIFYIGLRKKQAKQHNIVRKCINYLIRSDLETLTPEDLCVICNSTFKTTTKLNEKIFNTIINYLYNNLKILKDPAFFVTFLKSIRQNRYQDEDLLETLSYGMLFNKSFEQYSFSALSHILAVYSDYLYYDENVLRVFSERSIQLLKESDFISKKEHMSNHIRLKDIKRFLWCISNLNYKLSSQDIKTVIIPNILKRVKAGDVESDHSSLAEIALYLWMLNYRAYELFPFFLTKHNIRNIYGVNTHTKQRLNLLITCISYENKELLKDLSIPPAVQLDYDMKYQLEKRPELQRICSDLQTSIGNSELNKFELSCQVPGVNIIGITGYKNNTHSSVFLEVLDEYTRLKNTESMPTGLMELKLRLLNQLDEAVVLVDTEELKDLNSSEIRELLLDEIEFVC